MTTRTKRPTIRPGDLAFVVNAGLGGLPLFRIVSTEFDADGNITTYYLADGANPQNQGEPVSAQRVTAVFSNILNPQE